jgi:hypothetical protein
MIFFDIRVRNHAVGVKENFLLLASGLSSPNNRKEIPTVPSTGPSHQREEEYGRLFRPAIGRFPLNAQEYLQKSCFAQGAGQFPE